MNATTRNTCLIVGGAACGCLLLSRLISRIVDRTIRIAAFAALPTAAFLLAYDQFAKTVRDQQRFAPLRLQPFAVDQTALERILAIRWALVPGLHLDIHPTLRSESHGAGDGVRKAVLSPEWLEQFADALSLDGRLHAVLVNGTVSTALAAEPPPRVDVRVVDSVAQIRQRLPVTVSCSNGQVDDLPALLTVDCTVNLVTRNLDRFSARLVPAPG